MSWRRRPSNVPIPSTGGSRGEGALRAAAPPPRPKLACLAPPKRFEPALVNRKIEEKKKFCHFYDLKMQNFAPAAQ